MCSWNEMTSFWAFIFYNLIIIEVFIYEVETDQDFEAVTECPKVRAHWNTASARKACQGATPDYQCAAIENNVGKFGEICTRQGLSPANKCAVLNSQTYNLDFADCKAPTGCPTREYPSSEIYKYPVCYENFYEATTTISTTTDKDTTTGTENSVSSGAIVAIVLSVLVVVLLVVAVCGFVCYKRRTVLKRMPEGCHEFLPRCIKDETEEQNASETQRLKEDMTEKGKGIDELHKEDGKLHFDPERRGQVNSKQLILYDEEDEKTKRIRLERKKDRTFKNLEKYLVNILQNEIAVMDLKETIIVYAKSLSEHYNNLILMMVEKSEIKDDYHTFDIALIYTLLTNVCSNIKPPTSGWDFNPPAYDHSIGADIERIRLLWNKMCDEDLEEMENFKDVEDRMERRYGSINETYVEQYDEARLKIQSVKLNPECVVEDGIVITNGIKSTVTLLQSSNICFCKGAIGCGKTVLMNYIANKYKRNGWTVRMKDEQIKLEDTVVTDSQKILLCCDNFFGRYNFISAPKDDLRSVEKLLEEQYQATEKPGSLKILVLIHQHVFEELQKQVQFKLMQNKNITIDVDILSRAEVMMIFKEQRKTGHCTKDAKCWFRNIEYKDIETQIKISTGIVGNPALTMVYTNLHMLFSDESFSRSPFSSLEHHYLKMKDEEKNLYYTMVYIMLVKEYRLDDDLPEWCERENIPVTKDNIKNNISKLLFYLHRQGDIFEIKHEILYIALFRSCFSKSEDLSLLLRYCDLKTFLQLTLPSELGERTNAFTLIIPKGDKQDYNKTAMKAFAERILETESIHLLFMEHPLMNDPFLKSTVTLKKTN